MKLTIIRRKHMEMGHFSLYVLYVTFVVQSICCVFCNICPHPKDTIKYTSCPKNYAEWVKAAAKKNCSNISKGCAKDKQLHYHCLVNAYLNSTLEVCAEPRIILLHHCAEFSEKGGLVQENYFTDCRKFDPPCPVGYNSTEAYKFQGCYKKKGMSYESIETQLKSGKVYFHRTMTTTHPKQEHTTQKDEKRIKTSIDTESKKDRGRNADFTPNNTHLIIGITITAVICAVLILIFLYCCAVKKQICQRGRKSSMSDKECVPVQLVNSEGD